MLKQYKLSVLIVALVVTLGVLLLGQHFYEKGVVAAGLKQNLSRVATVREIQVDKKGTPPTVYVRIDPVSDLQVTYQRLSDLVHQQLGPDYFLQLRDNRSQKLQKLDEESQFAIQEAIVSGRFQEMKQTITHLAGSAGVTAEVWVDSGKVYLLLRDGSHYLYDIVSRPVAPTAPVTNNQGGGAS